MTPSKKNNAELEAWSIFFEEKNVSDDDTRVFISYISKLLENHCPIIFEFRHLALLMGVERYALAKMLSSRNSFYREFTIPKKNGGRRAIRSPYPILSHCQRWIYQNILRKLPVHESCYSYVPNRGIKQNAQLHLNKDHLLKLDIYDFFGSIPQNKITSLFSILGYSDKVSYQLSSLCCVDNQLPQGAPTSAYLSNLVMKPIDEKLLEIAKKYNLEYSRYADDITFSGNKIPIKIVKQISDILEKKGLILNRNKTIFKSGSCKKIVTGLSVCSTEVRVTKAFRRKFRQDCFYTIKNGLKSSNNNNHFDPLYIDRLIGRANFILEIEPTNKFVLANLPSLIKIKSDLSIQANTYA